MMQFSDKILDENVAPLLSKLTKCGAPQLNRFPNYFSEFMIKSALGSQRFKPHIHALLIAFYRRVDFSCEEYRFGRRRLKQYCDRLPKHNSQTRFYRLALSHFETSIIHVDAAFRCLEMVLKLLNQRKQGTRDIRIGKLRRISNRVRHFDEDVENLKTKQRSPISSPVWLTDDSIHSEKAALTFAEMRALLIEAMTEAKAFAQMLT